MRIFYHTWYLSESHQTEPIPNVRHVPLLNYLNMIYESISGSDIPSRVLNGEKIQTKSNQTKRYPVRRGQPLHVGKIKQTKRRLYSTRSSRLHGRNITGKKLTPDFQSNSVTEFKHKSVYKMALSNNKLDGTLDVGESSGKNLTFDLQNNPVTELKPKPLYPMFMSGDAPIYQGTGVTEENFTLLKRNCSFFPFNNCMGISCSPARTLSPNCKCSYPYTGTLKFFSYSFSDFKNSSYYGTLQGSLLSVLLSNGLPVDSVSVSDPCIDISSYLQFRFRVFPWGRDSFNPTEIATIGFLLIHQHFQLEYFGRFSFAEDSYYCFADRKSSNTGLIIGSSVGGSLLVTLLICAGVYALWQRRRARTAADKNIPFACLDHDKASGDVRQLKGTRWFSFEELRICTDNISESNCIGCGGYGKVYKGALTSGQLVAIQRAEQGSMQGDIEFKTEIDLLSRIHHKNIVSLVGFCTEQGEQTLVYEYIRNGTLRENLSGKYGIKLPWSRRLGIALDAARGLLYLHELANPPIIHRDIKSNNILLDDNLNAKVADFGLSKLLGDGAKGYVITQVKGTLGYMDPEYYMTEQLTDKSDVYSFGIVLLELVTARAAIEKGKHIAKSVQKAMDNANDLQNLYQIVDPGIGPGPNLVGLENFIHLAISCVRESAANRPTMGEVVREIENIMQLATSNYNTELVEFTSSSLEEITEASDYHSCDGEAFD